MFFIRFFLSFRHSLHWVSTRNASGPKRDGHYDREPPLVSSSIAALLNHGVNMMCCGSVYTPSTGALPVTCCLLPIPAPVATFAVKTAGFAFWLQLFPDLLLSLSRSAARDPYNLPNCFALAKNLHQSVPITRDHGDLVRSRRLLTSPKAFLRVTNLFQSGQAGGGAVPCLLSPVPCNNSYLNATYIST